MNREAERHLDKAKNYVEKGEQFYRKAALEIKEAQDADSTLVPREIAEQIGKSRPYVERLLRALAREQEGDEFRVDWESGSNKRGDVTAKFLRDAPIEQVEQAMLSLPEDRQKQVRTAVLGTSPALRGRSEGLGISESIKRREQNIGFHAVMMGTLSRLIDAVNEVQQKWDEHAENATEGDRKLVEDEIKDEVAKLLAMVSDPRELLA